MHRRERRIIICTAVGRATILISVLLLIWRSVPFITWGLYRRNTECGTEKMSTNVFLCTFECFFLLTSDIHSSTLCLVKIVLWINQTSPLRTIRTFFHPRSNHKNMNNYFDAKQLVLPHRSMFQKLRNKTALLKK